MAILAEFMILGLFCMAQYRCGSDLLTDYATVLSVFTHHQWIGGIFGDVATVWVRYSCSGPRRRKDESVVDSTVGKRQGI